MKIPFVDLQAQYKVIGDEIDKSIHKVIKETSFIGGKEVDKFEENFKATYGVRNCISVGNGTDSLYIIMKMLGIGEGDEVITPANSWISSSETITQTGATVVFADIEPDYFTIDPNCVECLITEKTKAIMPVHLFGQMCDMERLVNLSKKYNLFIIEDCAQSHFSALKGKRAGLWGDAGSFSFYPGKNLGAYGDAGAIITNSNDLAAKCKMYARHGALKKHEHEMEGINSRLDGIQAAVLNVKLKYIADWTQRRIQNADLYTKYLSGISEIVLPKIRPNSVHTWHLFVIRAEQRDELAIWLSQNGVATGLHYPRILPNLPAYRYLNYQGGEFPVASNYEKKIISLPIFPEMTEEQVEYVSIKVREFYK